MASTIPAALGDAADRFGEHPAYVQGDEVVSFLELLRRVLAEAVRRVAERGRDRACHQTSVTQPSNCLVQYHPWT